MGRWLARLQQEEKNVNPPGDETLKTFETPSDEVLRVLKVSHPGKSEKFQPDEIEREERLAVYGEAEDDPAQEREEASRAGERFQHIETRPGTRDGKRGADDHTPFDNIGGGASTKVLARSKAAAHAGRFEDRPTNWMPEPGPGVTILRPAVEVPAAEYDKHLDTMIAALPAGSPEAYRLAFAKKKGWCVDRGGERIFTRGRF